MSEIRRGALAIPGCDWIATGDCLFCGERAQRGAHWWGYGGDVVVCSSCVLEGKLGLLVGDALDDAGSIARAVVATEREAWRARVLAIERRAAS